MEMEVAEAPVYVLASRLQTEKEKDCGRRKYCLKHDFLYCIIIGMVPFHRFSPKFQSSNIIGVAG
jgi:hypothetical protein